MGNSEESGLFGNLSFLRLPHAPDNFSMAIRADDGAAGDVAQQVMSGGSSSSASSHHSMASNSMMMHMTFYWGRNVSILFDSWHTDEPYEYGLALLIVFLMCLLHQLLSVYRAKLESASSSSSMKPSAVRKALSLQDEIENSHIQPSTSLVDSPPCSSSRKLHYLSSFLYLVNVASSYLLMLIVMTYNAGLFMAVVMGLSCGYLLFRSPSARAARAYSAEACCE